MVRSESLIRIKVCDGLAIRALRINEAAPVGKDRIAPRQDPKTSVLPTGLMAVEPPKQPLLRAVARLAGDFDGSFRLLAEGAFGGSHRIVGGHRHPLQANLVGEPRDEMHPRRKLF